VYAMAYKSNIVSRDRVHFFRMYTQKIVLYFLLYLLYNSKQKKYMLYEQKKSKLQNYSDGSLRNPCISN